MRLIPSLALLMALVPSASARTPEEAKEAERLQKTGAAVTVDDSLPEAARLRVTFKTLDDKAAARWKAEQEQIRKALAEESAMRLWRTGFVEPVRGKRTGIFGSMRIMNGQPRNPHSGEDIGAPSGTPVIASNDGIVRLTVDHIFSGRGIYVDHGLGLYSMYFHLSEILVRDGDLVKAGQVIGKVGATGRATGPHLHWGANVNGARVNPYALLDLPFPRHDTSTEPVMASPVLPAKDESVTTATGDDSR